MDNLTILIEELKLIRNNVHGGLESNSKVDLTHSEVISFVRSFLSAVNASTIYPFRDLSTDDSQRIKFWLNLIRSYGLLHRDRSRAADKCLKACLKAIEQAKKKLEKQQSKCSGYPK